MTDRDVSVSMDAIEPSHRIEFWRAAMRPTYEITLVDSERLVATQYAGRIGSHRFGSLAMYSGPFFPLVPHERLRSRQTILRTGLDSYFVNLVSGRFDGDFDGRSMSAWAGDIYITDMSKPYACRVEASATLSVVVPRRELERRVGGRNLHGAVLRSNWAMTPLIRNCVLALDAARNDLSAAQIASAEDGLLSLIAAGLNADELSDGRLPPVLGSIFRQRVLDYIDAHIGDPNLGPELLARRFRVSRGHLYRAFEGDGGVATTIRQRRLDRAYGVLADPRSPHMSIKSVGALFGFPDSSQFVRAFRSRFGATPGAIQQGDEQPMGNGALSLHAHLSELQRMTETAKRQL